MAYFDALVMIFVFWESKREKGEFAWCLFCFVSLEQRDLSIPTLPPPYMNNFRTGVMRCRRIKWESKRNPERYQHASVCRLVTLYQCVIVTFWTQLLVWGSVIRNGWWMAIHYVRAGACIPACINLWLCSVAVSLVQENVSAWRKCRSSLGRVDEGAALQRLQDPMAPVSPVPQTDWEHLGSVSASGPYRLRSIWWRKEWIGSGRGRGKIWARFLSPMLPASMLRVCMCVCVLAHTEGCV